MWRHQQQCHSDMLSRVPPQCLSKVEINNIQSENDLEEMQMFRKTLKHTGPVTRNATHFSKHEYGLTKDIKLILNQLKNTTPCVVRFCLSWNCAISIHLFWVLFCLYENCVYNFTSMYATTILKLSSGARKLASTKTIQYSYSLSSQKNFLLEYSLKQVGRNLLPQGVCDKWFIWLNGNCTCFFRRNYQQKN